MNKGVSHAGSEHVTKEGRPARLECQIRISFIAKYLTNDYKNIHTQNSQTLHESNQALIFSFCQGERPFCEGHITLTI